MEMGFKLLPRLAGRCYLLIHELIRQAGMWPSDDAPHIPVQKPHPIADQKEKNVEQNKQRHRLDEARAFAGEIFFRQQARLKEQRHQAAENFRVEVRDLVERMRDEMLERIIVWSDSLLAALGAEMALQNGVAIRASSRRRYCHVC